MSFDAGKSACESGHVAATFIVDREQQAQSAFVAHRAYGGEDEDDHPDHAGDHGSNLGLLAHDWVRPYWSSRRMMSSSLK